MAQFIAFHPDAEVTGGTVLSFVNAMKRGQESRIAILAKHNVGIVEGEWYLQQGWLDAFKEVAETLGEMNLFLMGAAIIENAKFPPMRGLEDALRSIDIAYHMNHRLNGQVMFDPNTGAMLEGIGHYTLVSFDEKNRQAVYNCQNPYPSKFDEGIISEVVRRFKPADSTKYEVKLDITKERRTQGADSCTYIITW
jgi:hypothetical protein